MLQTAKRTRQHAGKKQFIKFEPKKKIFGSQYFQYQLENLSAAPFSQALQKSSSTELCLPPNVVFHPRLSSTESRHPPKVIFHQRLSSTEGYLPLKVVFHRRLSSNEDCLPPKIVFHRRLSSTEGCLPPTIVICLNLLF